MYIVALRLPRRSTVPLLGGTLLAVAGAIAASMSIMVVSRHDSRWLVTTGSRVLVSSVVLTAAWMIGYAVRQQRAYTAGLREQAERRAREQVAQARRAISEERLRIARELHDVVAHSMSLIAVQAGVANYVVGSRPEEAARALASIEETSRGALREMRTLLGVLRADGNAVAHRPAEARRGPGEAELLPAPGLADLDRLVMRSAEAGVRVDLEVLGERQELSAGLDLAAYRVIQEAVTNVIKHAATDACTVILAYEQSALSLEITDKGRGSAPGGAGPGNEPGADPASADAAYAADGHGIVGMHVSLSTAKTHVGRLLMKLTARDRAQLVIAAYETGLVQPP